MELPPRVDSTFRYVLLAARRAEQLMRGAVAKVPPSSKPTRTAMAELAEDLVAWDYGPPPQPEEPEPIVEETEAEVQSDELA
ncbi:MAG: DNA-directed RNA polymerase subunit omega [Thermoanaerobaculia bacterium]|nr:DNA-directed RNA polymerase subunit omega [Thermoanaerobaculia bacterium]MDI9630741.1 DNA-directed RNA polymerase subunit omega [Acidobacteriota bacterium]MBP7813943.1 DNA-directed RNA polymerase subunit omega [Thermoanaerobaculia bacterium]HRR13101.1 DNA-directed RNA polymerase subunit omega [Thermoanaerobaculia bacterium]HRS35034.1 DNA-directed RNA polymerase subunit omega [Thermoanaerobaculia bacterium]